jgi:threonine dehydrogenase-like Zn-dependent dehydrogenase
VGRWSTSACRSPIPERLARVSRHGAETLHLDEADPITMMQLFDKQVQVRTGRANVRAWTDELLGMLTDDDPFGVDSSATHHLPLEDAPSAYEHFQKKEQGMVKVVFRP